MGVVPPDYGAARQRFREAAAHAGWALESHSVGATGPAGEDLTIDVAASRAPGAARTLIVSSGLHGVEGPFGSAVQTALLESCAADDVAPTSVRCVFVHALNPYGFAWSRRCDAENVDPNRNFVLDERPSEASRAAYARFDRLLNPRRPPSALDLFYPRAIWTAAVHGLPTLKQALVTGQYEFPNGLFYGGAEPSATHRVVAEQLAGWAGGATLVLHLDLHTGLGRWGRGKLLLDYSLSKVERARLAEWFGAGAIEDGDPRGVAYRACGSLGPWVVSRRVAPVYLFAFAEFGTYGNLRVLAGLRAENQAHHWAAPDAPGTTRAKARLRELFCPADSAWRARALAGGVSLVRRAVDGLAHR